MSNGGSNVERLVAAEVLDDSRLTEVGRQRINEMSLTDEEIAVLKTFKETLGLYPLQLTDPTDRFSNMGQL
jgi:hypothetical protein